MKVAEGPIVLEYKFSHSAAKIWSALVEIEQMPQWFFPNIPDFKAELTFKTQFPVQSESRTFTHLWEVVKVVPGSEIAYKWEYAEYPGKSVIHFSLQPQEDSVLLKIFIEVIEDFPDEIPEFKRESCIGGWNYFIDQQLRTYLNGQSQNTWSLIMPLAKAYKIETERLIIRCYHPRDAVLLKQSIDESIEHLLPWMPWAKFEPEDLDKKIARLRKYRGQFDLGEDYTFGIFNKDESELIGSTGLHTRLGEHAREIGYWIGARHIRKGYATEVVQALSKVGFEIEDLERIEIHCSPNNLASQSVPRKLGYQLEATLKHRTVDTEGQKRDVMIWTMFKEDYLQSEWRTAKVKAFNVLGGEIG